MLTLAHATSLPASAHVVLDAFLESAEGVVEHSFAGAERSALEGKESRYRSTFDPEVVAAVGGRPALTGQLDLDRVIDGSGQDHDDVQLYPDE